MFAEFSTIMWSPSLGDLENSANVSEPSNSDDFGSPASCDYELMKEKLNCSSGSDFDWISYITSIYFP